MNWLTLCFVLSCNEVWSVTSVTRADVFKIEHRGDLADHDTGPTLVMILLTDVSI